MRELDPRIEEQVYRVIETAEARYINALFNWETNAKHRAENCKCPQCIREIKRASGAISQELDRIAPPLEEEKDYGDYGVKKKN